MAKRARAVYPKPESVHLGSMVVRGVDGGKPEIEVDDEFQRRLQSVMAKLRDRYDLTGRLIGIKNYLMRCLEPHWGVKADAKWEDIEQALGVFRLPENAPNDAELAMLSLKTMSSLWKALVQIRELRPEIKAAVCDAIDLGRYLQRIQVETDLGEAVDLGRRNVDSRKAAGSKRAAKSEERRAAAEAEYLRRRSDGKPKMKTTTLTNMSREKLPDGKTLKWGSLATLKRWEQEGQWERKV